MSFGRLFTVVLHVLGDKCVCVCARACVRVCACMSKLSLFRTSHQPRSLLMQGRGDRRGN